MDELGEQYLKDCGAMSNLSWVCGVSMTTLWTATIGHQHTEQTGRKKKKVFTITRVAGWDKSYRKTAWQWKIVQEHLTSEA